MKNLLKILVMLMFVLLVVVGCSISTIVDKGSDSPKSKPDPNPDAPTPEEILTMSEIVDELEEADMPIYEGDYYVIDDSSHEIIDEYSSKNLTGYYLLRDGDYIDSSLGDSVIVIVIDCGIWLKSQTNSGRISATQYASNVPVGIETAGSYITGSENNFTIWQQNRQESGSFYLEQIQIISGTKLSNGDFEIQVFNKITDSYGVSLPYTWARMDYYAEYMWDEDEADYDDHGNNASSATSISVGGTKSGIIKPFLDFDYFSFYAVSGQMYEISGYANTIDQIGFGLLVKGCEEYIHGNYDDIIDSGDNDEPLIWTCDSSGNYVFLCTGGVLEHGSYSVSVKNVASLSVYSEKNIKTSLESRVDEEYEKIGSLIIPIF